ncbi:MarR family winged helix-turn-helix transcriptional regulator [Catellatospora sichuanensis]|uniref:MarR family winged helix-turn-helix transcriptional regulator n=1 Tax=Catellatospora sichuanensis TaxID=1969805 RepID=UPI00118408D2|nr:MarR family transcriptional regulator [Catellatospora sichuanensis]
MDRSTSAVRAPGLPALGAGSLLHQVARELTTVLDRDLARHDLTSQQAALLLHAAGEAATPSSLKATLGTDTAGMTRLLDRLEGKGLLRRTKHPRDRRAIVIELTTQGRALVPHLPSAFGRVVGRLLTGFDDTEVAQLRAMLDRMLANLAAEGDPS